MIIITVSCSRHSLLLSTTAVSARSRSLPAQVRGVIRQAGLILTMAVVALPLKTRIARVAVVSGVDRTVTIAVRKEGRRAMATVVIVYCSTPRVVPQHVAIVGGTNHSFIAVRLAKASTAAYNLPGRRRRQLPPLLRGGGAPARGPFRVPSLTGRTGHL